MNSPTQTISKPSCKFLCNLKINEFNREKESFREYLVQFKINCKILKIPREDQVDLLLTKCDHQTVKEIDCLQFSLEENIM